MSQTSAEATAPARRLAVLAIREVAPGERRVALTPDSVGRLTTAGMDVMVEAGAGVMAGFSDQAYVAAGASIARGDGATRAIGGDRQ